MANTWMPTPSPGRVFMYGGVDTNGNSQDFTYRWSWTGNTWESDNIHNTLVGKRSSTRMVWFGTSPFSKTLLFGGQNCIGFSCTLYSNQPYSFTGSSWSTCCNLGQLPSKRIAEAMAWDQNAGVVVVFGGNDAAGQETDPSQVPIGGSFWMDSNQNWTQCTNLNGCSTLPTNCSSATMDYDPTTHKDVMYGGTTGTANGETWFYNQGAPNRWTKCSSTDCQLQESPSCIRTDGPCASSSHRMTHYLNGTTNEMVTFGRGLPSLGNDVYIFTGDTTTGNWSLWVAPAVPGIPAPRCCMLWAFDPNQGKILMFGGQHANNAAYADTWSWHQGLGWTCLITPCSS